MIMYISPNDNTTFDIHNPGDYVKNFVSWNKDFEGISAKQKQKYEHCLASKIIMMKPSSYIRKCMDIHQKGYETLVTNNVDFQKVNKYAEDMLNGDTFPIPYLNYVYAETDGLHRVLAYQRAFGEEVELPVLEIHRAGIGMDDIYAYVTIAYPGREDSKFTEFAKIHGYSDDEINEYLGNPVIEDDTIDNSTLDMMNALDKAESEDININDLTNYNVTFDYAADLKTLCDKSGKSMAELSKLTPSQFNKLLDKYL